MYKVLVIGWNKQNPLYKYFISLQFYPDHQHQHHHLLLILRLQGIKSNNILHNLHYFYIYIQKILSIFEQYYFYTNEINILL